MSGVTIGDGAIIGSRAVVTVGYKPTVKMFKKLLFLI